MPIIQANGISLSYELAGPESAPVVVFSNSLGTTLEMWDAQAHALAGRYRVLRYNTRGHGQSQVIDQPATIETLTDDLAGLLDGLGIGRAHIVGLSIGGMTAQMMGIRHPDKVLSLSLLATSPHMPTRESWEERAAKVRAEGLDWLADGTMGRWFTAGFHAAHPQEVARQWAQFVATDRVGYAICCGAIAVMDLRPSLAAIKAPTLIIAGSEDPAAPPAHAEEIRSRVADAELLVLPHAAHLLAVEQPERVGAVLADFLDRQSHGGRNVRAGGASFEEGLVNRKSVLGDAHVERSLAKAGSFSMPWQDFITRMAWGEIWGDPTIPWKTRSLVTLAMMVALHREEEFKLHVRPALKNGVTIEELRSLLLQTAIYGGVPAANAAFRWAKDVLGDEIS